MFMASSAFRTLDFQRKSAKKARSFASGRVDPTHLRDREAVIEKTGEGVMSQHPSLKSASRIKVKRNVLKRFERIDILRESGKWKEGDRGVGLPKTKSEE